jgi:uncharacterized membrane protein
VVVDWLHFVADGLWLGGQIYIVAVLMSALRLGAEPAGNLEHFLAILNRFSPVAYASVVLYSASGPFNGVQHITTWYDFFYSVYTAGP